MSLGEFREGHSRKRALQRQKKDPSSGRAGGWVTRWHKHSARLTELERPREARSLGAQLAMTESELDPELEGNGVGKLNGVFAFEKYY